MPRNLMHDGKTAGDVVRENSYTRDDGIDRDALRERNRVVLIANGFTEDEVERILAGGAGE